MTEDDLNAPSDRLSFDTEGMGEEAAFEAYCRLYGAHAEVLRLGGPIMAKVAAWRLDRMLLYDRRLDGIGHRRDAPQVQADRFDHFTATLLLSGEHEMEMEDGPPRILRPGEVLLVDTRVPSVNRAHGAHFVTLSIARERMVAMAGSVDGLHGLTLSANEARLFREFVESLLRNLPTLPASATLAAASVLTTLLMIGINAHGGALRDTAGSRDAERLAKLKRLIDARIVDPDFDAAAVIRESDLSRATLYRLATPDGGLATLIRNRRLDQIRRHLGDASDTRSFEDLAAAMGMSSAGNASRLFVERYAIRPGEYRDLATAPTGGDALLKMRLWQEEVR